MTQTETIRLSKRMAELGLCSRAEADDYIAQGLVEVDGKVVDVLGSRVHPGQTITLRAGGPRQQAERITALLHKQAGQPAPMLAGQLVPANRASEDMTGMVYLRKHQQRLVWSGALADEESGLCVLTQDGRLARQWADGDYEQEWLVNLARPLSDTALQQLQGGMLIDGQTWRAGRISRQSERQLCVVLRKPAPGRITALLASAGLTAERIHCIRMGRVRLGKLPAGQWRYLPVHEKF